MVGMARETVFITGGGSGIGAGLARAFHGRGAQVIIAGRDAEKLGRVVAECPGMESVVLDVTDGAAVERCAAELGARHPGLNVVINNAGVQDLIDFTGEPPSLRALDREIDINLKGLIYVTAAFLPGLRRQAAARLVQVSSGLGFVPLVRAPIYSATKAGVHGFSLALREQLRGTTVRVIELIPPLVETELHAHQKIEGAPAGMPLARFVEEAMRAIERGTEEAAIGLARMLRIGARVAPRRFLKLINRG